MCASSNNRKTTKMRSENMSMHIEIVFIGNIKKKFCVSAKERETISYFGIVIFWLGGKTCTEKTISIVFNESRYLNSNPEIGLTIIFLGKLKFAGTLWSIYTNILVADCAFGFDIGSTCHF